MSQVFTATEIANLFSTHAAHSGDAAHTAHSAHSGDGVGAVRPGRRAYGHERRFPSVSQPAFWIAALAPSTDGGAHQDRHAQATLKEKKKLQCQLGQKHEHDGIARYERMCMSGDALTDQNTHTRHAQLVLPSGAVVEVRGRVDGLANGGRRVVEHKYRARSLLGYVPQHERVQCHVYMHMTGATDAHLVETHGEHMRVHEVGFDDALWQRTLARVDARRRQKNENKNA